MYNIYSIVILILFDIPRFSVNDLHQIQVAAPSPSSRKSSQDVTYCWTSVKVTTKLQGITFISVRWQHCYKIFCLQDRSTYLNIFCPMTRYTAVTQTDQLDMHHCMLGKDMKAIHTVLSQAVCEYLCEILFHTAMSVI